MISIIVPVYNVEKYLAHCINTIINQTYRDWECILIDDGSSDRSSDICDEYAKLDDRIVVVHKSNEGVSKARNQGIELAKGEFITFIDSDDFISNDYLQSFMDCHPQKDSITVQGVITKTPITEFLSYSYPDAKSITIDKAGEYIMDYDVFKDGGPVNKLFCRELINQYNIRFNPKLSFHEDHIFVYEYYLHCKLINLSSHLGYYYMYYGVESSNSLSRLGKRNYNGLILASQSFKEILPRLFQYYNISDKKYIQKVMTRNGYSQVLLAIQSVYLNNDISDSERIKFLSLHIKEVREFRLKYYRPTLKRLLMLTVMSLPIKAAHLILTKVFSSSNE